MGGLPPTQDRSACLRQPARFRRWPSAPTGSAVPLKTDNGGRAAFATVVPRTTIKAWSDDFDVPYKGKA